MGNHCETVLTEFHHENSQSISEINKWNKNLLLIKSFSKAKLTISNKKIFDAEKSMKSYIKTCCYVLLKKSSPFFVQMYLPLYYGKTSTLKSQRK